MLIPDTTILRQLLQRIQASGAISVTFLAILGNSAAADPHEGLPPGISGDEPSLTLISPLDGLTLETYGPAEPYDLLTKLRFGFSLDHENNKRIAMERDWYVRHPDYLDRVFTRAQRYLPYITAELERRSLPLELALLPIVESAYDPFAYSHGRAAGLWQMIPGTARRSTTSSTSMNSTKATGSMPSLLTIRARAMCARPYAATARPASPTTSGT